MERDLDRLRFLVRVLTAACDKGIIPKAPWSEWLVKPDPEAMKAYGSMVTPLLTGPDEGVAMHIADVAYRTLRLLQGRQSVSMDEASLVGMLLRSMYDMMPYAREQIETACLKAFCRPMASQGRVARVARFVQDRPRRYTVDLWVPDDVCRNVQHVQVSHDAPSLKDAGNIARELRDAALADGWPEGTYIGVESTSGSGYGATWRLQQATHGLPGGLRWVRQDWGQCADARSKLQHCKVMRSRANSSADLRLARR